MGMAVTSALGRREGRLAVATVVLAVALVLPGGTAAAQSASAPAMKAAFLYNFAKFAQWPADALPPGQPLVLCVLDDHEVADALEQMVRAQIVEGHALTLRVVSADGPIRSCHLLYAGGPDSKQAAQLMNTLTGAAVFSVGDRDRFAERGGVAQFFVENDRMRFAINTVAAQRARITLSSKLLSLAKIVKDAPHVQ